MRVGEAHPTRPRREQQAGNTHVAFRVDLHRIDAVVLQSPEQHIDRFQTGQRPQPHAALPHDEVGAFREVQSEPGGEVRLLDVRRMVDPTRQHHDARVLRGGDVGEAVPESIGERIERPQCPPSGEARDHVAMDSSRHRAGEQRVADTGRCVGEISNDAPPTGRVADHVDGVVREPAPVWSRAEGGQPILRTPPQRSADRRSRR